MIDPHRESNTLPPAQADRGGLFASIADAISEILDDKAGVFYAQQMANVGSTLTLYSNRALHFSFGAFTIKAPIYYHKAMLTQSLAQDSLRILLQPKASPDGQVHELLENANGEVGAEEVGQGGAKTFFGYDSKTFDEQAVLNAPLCQRVLEVWTVGNDEDYKKNQILRKGLEADFAALNINEIATPEWRHRLMMDVSLSRPLGRDPNLQSEKDRIQKEVNESKLRHLGAWDQENDTRGLLGESLRACQNEQVRRFGYFLRAYCEEILNGTSPNVTTSKKGKLGYLIGLVNGIKDGLIFYKNYVSAIEGIITDEGLPGKAEQKSARTKKRYEDNPNKKTIFNVFESNRVHPDSYKFQEDWVKAHQDTHELLKRRILLERLKGTMVEMIAIVEDALTNLNLWKGQLIGLYNRWLEEKNNVQANRNAEEGQNDVREVLDKGFEHYEADPAVLLEELTWSAKLSTYKKTLDDNAVEEKVNGLDFGFQAIDDDHTIEFQKDETLFGNIEKWSELAGHQIEMLLTQNPPPCLAEALNQTPGLYTSGELANFLYHKADPLYVLTNGGAGPLSNPGRVGTIRVYQPAEYQQYFHQAFTLLQNQDPLVNLNNLAELSDKYKLTYFRHDDCIDSRDFEMWQICRQAYIDYTSPHNEKKPEHFHVFPNEINACRFEDKIRIVLGKKNQILDPRVVALLEDSERIELFFRALAVGYICQRKNEYDQVENWVYQLPDSNGIQLVIVDQETDYFKLINQFCNIISNKKSLADDNCNKEKIDPDILKNAFYSQLEQRGEDWFRRLCQEQIDQGVVLQLRKKVYSKRTNQSANLDSFLKNRIASDLESLADLAETIYREAIRCGR
jgi:hypothetical protein